MLLSISNLLHDRKGEIKPVNTSSPGTIFIIRPIPGINLISGPAHGNEKGEDEKNPLYLESILISAKKMVS
jgi:hypothetical protein